MKPMKRIIQILDRLLFNWVGPSRHPWLDCWWVRCSLPPWGWFHYLLVDRPNWKNSLDED